MHFSWFIHLFVFVLFSLSSSDETDFYPDYIKEEHEYQSASSTFTVSLLLKHPTEEVEDYHVPWNIMETTTPTKKTTKHHMFSHNIDDIEYQDDYEDETENEKVSSTTSTVSSSSNTIRLTRRTSTVITTTKSDIPVTRSIWTLGINREILSTTTIDPKQVAFFLAKSNRDRLFLKIFAIAVIVCMSSLAVIFITIHMVRKVRRYRGYRTPANTSSNEQSKHTKA